MHSGLTDPRAMGRAGGLKAPETQLRREVRDDEKIRESAKDVLRRGLAGDESVTKTMLDAARSVFSFRAAQPPAEAQTEREPLLTPRGRPIATLEDVFMFGVENEGSREAIAPMIERVAARLAEIRAEGKGHDGRAPGPSGVRLRAGRAPL